MLYCEVAIVGGGIGGLYTAESLLRHEKETNVCLFERNERLGGRFYDYVFRQVPNETVGRCIWLVFRPLLRKAMTAISSPGRFVIFSAGVAVQDHGKGKIFEPSQVFTFCKFSMILLAAHYPMPTDNHADKLHGRQTGNHTYRP